MVLAQSETGARNINTQTQAAMDRALTRRINVPQIIADQQAKSNQYMLDHAADEILDFTPTREQLAAYKPESTFNPHADDSRAKFLRQLQNRADNLGVSIYDDIQNLKNKQLDKLRDAKSLDSNISSVDDIKTWKEAIQDNGNFIFDDFTEEQAKEALNRQVVKVYSANPLQNGEWVSTSRQQAESMAGGDIIYETEVPIFDVAWINGNKGKVALSRANKVHFVDEDRGPYIRTLQNTLEKPDITFAREGNPHFAKKYTNNDSGNDFFDVVYFDENGKLYGKFGTTDFDYFRRDVIKGRQDASLNSRLIGDYESPMRGDASNSHTNNIPLKSVVVNPELENISSMYEGLSPYQRRSLGEAVNRGVYNTNQKAGSLESINKIGEELDNMISVGANGVNALQGVKNRIDNVIGTHNKAYQNTQRLGDAYHQGQEYNTGYLNTGVKPLERNAFAQGMLNKLGQMSNNLSEDILQNKSVFERVLPKNSSDEMLTYLNGQSNRMNNLRTISNQANSRLTTSPQSSVWDNMYGRVRGNSYSQATQDLLNPNFIGQPNNQWHNNLYLMNLGAQRWLDTENQ